MARQSISLTQPNDKWLKAQIEDKEYSSKSELVNDLIRKERARLEKLEFLRLKLSKSEKSGIVDQSPEDMLAEFKERARLDGSL